MADQTVAYFAFNRGLVSRLALTRADLKRLAAAADVYLNFMPRELGSMMLRPGMGYLGTSKDNAAAKYLPFVFSTADKAILELTALCMRVWVNDVVISRVAVTAVVLNGDFTLNLNNWTDNDEVGATSTWVAGVMDLNGDGVAAAIRDQTIAVPAADVGKEHALTIVVDRGPVAFSVGTVTGGGQYIAETELGTGTHSLAFTPAAGNMCIRFKSRLARAVLVASCNFAAAGDMVVPTPWTADDLGMVRIDQSGDVVFTACEDFQPRKIERRSTTSWSVVLFEPEDGPFRVANVDPIMTLTASVLVGNGTLTASLPTFFPTHVGALFAVTSTGQLVQKSINAQNIFSDPVEVSGVGTDRSITIVVVDTTGTGTTLTLQRSFGAIGTWVDVTTYVVDTSTAYNDGFDNQIVFYRVGVKTGDFAAGPVGVNIYVGTGSIRGICRVTAYTSNVVVSMEVLTAFGSVTASDNWEEGRWSPYRGWPSSVALYEGRLGFAGKDSVVLSVSDGFESFDPTVEGDSGTIGRTIGSGPVDTINWMLPLQRLLLGGQGAEFSGRSTAFDEPLTPTNFNLKRASTQGSAAVPGVVVDSEGIYVQRGGFKVYMLEYSGDKNDYISNHLSAIVPEIGKPGIVRIAVQRQPDTRVHFVRSDGTAAVLLFNKVENLICWIEVDSPAADGLIEDVVILPSDTAEAEDHVYYLVKRTINGADVRYFERWATEAESRGLEDDNETVTPLCMLADSYVSYTGYPTNVIYAAHLEGEEVVVWADGADIGHDDDDALIYTVTGGQITLADGLTVENAVVGLPYTAQWRSGKLVQLATQMGSALKRQKAIPNLGIVLADVHAKGIKFGQDFDHLDDLPSMEDGAPNDPDRIRSELDGQAYVFPGTWAVDARLCLQSIAPRPCTVLALVADVDF